MRHYDSKQKSSSGATSDVPISVCRLLDYRHLREQQGAIELRQWQQQQEPETARLLALENDLRIVEQQLSETRGGRLFGDGVGRRRLFLSNNQSGHDDPEESCFRSLLSAG